MNFGKTIINLKILTFCQISFNKIKENLIEVKKWIVNNLLVNDKMIHR